jgi:hypothetical protein
MHKLHGLSPMIPGKLLFCGVLLGASLPLQAHFEKPLDRNGGHWDEGGFYHCHEPQCRPAPHRFQFQRISLSNRVEDLHYLAEDWPHWLPLAGCKTARTVVLEETSRAPVTWTNPRQCEIREGLWIDAYTGEEFTRAAQMEIDHIIPPLYANAANGYQWDFNKRSSFSNDLLNLIPVSRDVFRRKAQRGIGRWQPPNKDFHCEYAQHWKDVSEKYDLRLFASDASRMNTILKDCDTGTSISVDEQ